MRLGRRLRGKKLEEAGFVELLVAIAAPSPTDCCCACATSGMGGFARVLW
eukprot:SAG22_NODE_10050_length_556_cov_0.630197_1_plen_49_part_10